MKRFYCTVCKRVKRVRNYPRNVRNAESVNVADRQGTCKYHESVEYGYSRKVKVS